MELKADYNVIVRQLFNYNLVHIHFLYYFCAKFQIYMTV